MYVCVIINICIVRSVRGHTIDFETMPMTLLNATNFIMRHQRYLLQDDQRATDAATVRTSGNEGNCHGTPHSFLLVPI